MVERIRAGDPYYPAFGEELRMDGYPTASVFDWKTPTLYVGMAAVPRWLPLPLMASLCVVLLGLFMVYLARHGSAEGTIIGLVLSAGAAGTLADQQGRWLTESWSGVLIGPSLVVYRTVTGNLHRATAAVIHSRKAGCAVRTRAGRAVGHPAHAVRLSR